jgi:hypothetical protein
VIEPGIGSTAAKAAEPAAREIRAAEMMVFMVIFLLCVWVGGGPVGGRGRGEPSRPPKGASSRGALIKRRWRSCG